MAFEARSVPLGAGANANRSYVSRAERQDVLFPVVFTRGDGTQVAGTCENLSASGLLATFAVPLDIWTYGAVDLLFGVGLLGLHVRIARMQGQQVGMAFQDMDDARRGMIREMMTAAGETGYLPDHL